MAFSDQMIDDVWAKIAESSNAEDKKNGFKKDMCSAWIKRSSYGKTSTYGWEIDHITPKSDGGKDILSNLRPLHWGNNRARSNGRLNTTKPAVKSVGVENHQLDENGHYKKI